MNADVAEKTEALRYYCISSQKLPWLKNDTQI